MGAYREGDVDAAHPLAALLSRWGDQAGVRTSALANLPGRSLVEMVADMLHADRAKAAALVAAIEPHTRGNPYETVELLDALHRDGVLQRRQRPATDDGGSLVLACGGPRSPSCSGRASRGGRRNPGRWWR